MSLKSNFIYSSILTVSKYLFPLIVYPYVSRTLGLSNIGVVNFVDNLVNYFVFLSMMGITTVGVREIASVKNDRVQLSRTFMSLLMLTVISTLIAIIALWGAMYTVETLYPHRTLLYVGIVKLVFNLLLIEWFYMGMENFRYITNRTLLIKCMYVVGVFAFVKEASDYDIYYALTVATVVANALVNLIYSRRFVNYNLKAIDLKPYYKPFLTIGVYILLTNVYTYLNPVWLGFVTNTDEVGYFTTATKLHNIIMAVLLSFANILFPRVSQLLAEGKEKEFWEKINLSLEAVFLFAFPTIVFMLVAGPQLLHLFVGNGFEGSYLPLRIIAPLTLIVGIEQILVIQILMAMHEDSCVLRNSLIGALTAFVLNMLITSSFRASGSAIVWVVSEVVIMLLSLSFIRSKYAFSMPWKRLIIYGLTYLPLFLSSLLLHTTIDNEIIMLIGEGILVVGYAVVVEVYVLRNKVANLLIDTIHSVSKSKK